MAVVSDLLVIVPTRGRPQEAADLAQTWLETSTGDAILRFVVDTDDPLLDRYNALVDSWPPDIDLAWHQRTPQRMAGALNAEARQSAHYHRHIGFMGDDHRPRTRGWDEMLIAALDKQDYGVAYGNDLFQGPNLPTAVFLDARIVRALGRMVPPDLVHLYLDNYWRDLGIALGTFTYLPNVVIEHMHPAAGKAEWTEGHREVNAGSMYERDRIAYEQFVRYGGLVKDVTRIREFVE